MITDLIILASVILGIFFLMLAVSYLVWRRTSGRIRTRSETRVAFNNVKGSPTGGIDTSEMPERMREVLRKKGMIDENGMFSVPENVNSPGTHTFSSVSYSSGSRWGKVEVTEKNGERIVREYGDTSDMESGRMF